MLHTNVNRKGEGLELAWFGSGEKPPGRDHGASGICLVESRSIVLVTRNGVSWDLPGGRPELNEDPEQTLEREVQEEACADMLNATHAGYGQATCRTGPHAGQVIVRTLWVADVTLGEWNPGSETIERIIVTPCEAATRLANSDAVFAPLFALVLPGLVSRPA